MPLSLSYNVIHAVTSEIVGIKDLLHHDKIVFLDLTAIQYELIQQGRFDEDESEEVLNYIHTYIMNDNSIHWFHDDYMILLDGKTLEKYIEYCKNGKELDYIHTEEQLFNISTDHPYWEKVKKYIIKLSGSKKEQINRKIEENTSYNTNTKGIYSPFSTPHDKEMLKCPIRTKY